MEIKMKKIKIKIFKIHLGIRINSPHYLVKLVDDETVTYTLVISQYEKYNSIYYTLKTYSTQQFELNEIKEPYNSKYSKRVINFNQIH
jgi:calpain-7